MSNLVGRIFSLSNMAAAAERTGTASSPVARDHWEIFELIIKESGDKGSDGK